MNPRIVQLERTLRKCWGAMLLADSVVNDPKVKAAFLKVDSECREIGLSPQTGMRFVDRKPEESSENC